MKNLLAIAPLCLLSLSLAAGQEASKTSSIADQIKKHEQNWAQATVKEGAAAVDQYEADDIIATLQQLQASGAIRAFGLSARSPGDARTAIERYGLGAVQVNFNLIDQSN